MTLFEAGELYTVREISTALKVHPNTVREWLTTGELPGANYGGRSGWRVKGEDLNAFHERRVMRKGEASG